MKIINNIKDAIEDDFYILKNPKWDWVEYYVIVEGGKIAASIKSCSVQLMQRLETPSKSDIKEGQVKVTSWDIVGVSLIVDTNHDFKYRCPPDEADEIMREFCYIDPNDTADTSDGATDARE